MRWWLPVIARTGTSMGIADSLYPVIECYGWMPLSSLTWLAAVTKCEIRERLIIKMIHCCHESLLKLFPGWWVVTLCMCSHNSEWHNCKHLHHSCALTSLCHTELFLHDNDSQGVGGYIYTNLSPIIGVESSNPSGAYQQLSHKYQVNSATRAHSSSSPALRG